MSISILTSIICDNCGHTLRGTPEKKTKTRELRKFAKQEGWERGPSKFSGARIDICPKCAAGIYQQ